MNKSLQTMINQRKMVIDNLCKNTEILDKQFKSHGLKITALGYDFNYENIESDILNAYIEIASVNMKKLNCKSYCITITQTVDKRGIGFRRSPHHTSQTNKNNAKIEKLAIIPP